MTDADFEHVNGYSWDYCLCFAVLEDEQEATAFQREWSMRKIMQRIAAAGLEYKLFKGSTVEQKDVKSMVFCKVRASMERLKMEADRTDYKLLMDATTLRQKIEDGFPRKPDHKAETDKHDYKIAPNCIQDIKGASKRSPYDNIYGKYEQDGPSWPKTDKRYKTEEDGGIDGNLYYAWRSDKLGGNKSGSGERLIFRSVDRLKLIMSILEGPTAMKGCNLNFDKLKKPNGPRTKAQHAALLNNYPLHDVEERQALEKEWMRPFYMPNAQPLDRVKNYFGEKVALYFGWLGHYTTWLITPAVLGVAAQIEIGADATNDVVGLSFFGFFMCLWSTFFLEFWKRKQSTLSMEWGMKGFEDEEDERPAFEGEDITSPVTGESMKWFNPVAKLKKVLYSVLIIGSMIMMVVGIVLGIMIFKESQKKAGTLLINSPPVYVFQLGGLLNAVQIQITNMFYQTWAEYLNDQENHRTDTQYEDALITKVFLFQFVNSFASFFFIAFIKEEFFGWDCLGSHTCSDIKYVVPAGTDTSGADGGCLMANQEAAIQSAKKFGQAKYMCDPDALGKAGCGDKLQFTPTAPCLDELNVQLLSIFVVRLVVGNFTEAVLPWILRTVKARKEKKAAAKGLLVTDANDSSVGPISPAEEQFALADYQKGAGKDGTFEDYAEMIVQFGFASLFVVAFPLAPLLAAINNHIEIRVDAFKLLHLQKRAEPKGAEDIGTWYNILEIMATCGVITNSLLVVFTASALFGTYETKQKWVAFVLMEHVILLIKFGFALAVDDEPATVAMQVSRQDFLISKVIDRVADDDDELFVKTKGELKMEILEHDDTAGTDVFAEASTTALAGSAGAGNNRGEV